jgi:hypothetical protein
VRAGKVLLNRWASVNKVSKSCFRSLVDRLYDIKGSARGRWRVLRLAIVDGKPFAWLPASNEHPDTGWQRAM